MNVALVSQDPELFKLFRDTATGYGLSCEIALISPDNPTVDSDIYLWDLAATEPPEWVGEEPWRHYFLADRADAAGFPERAGAAHVLLKPVTRAALAAFLESAALLHNHEDEDGNDLLLRSLVNANVRLQEYEQDRANFLARAAHDFHAPLTAIGGYCGLLLGGPLGALNEGQREVLHRMEHSARRLARMASAMFHLSVAGRAERPIEFRPADLRACLAQSLHNVSLSAQEKRIDISADLSPEWQNLRFDPEQIEQVLTNLLDNACKFVPKFGAVQIRGYRFFWQRRGPGATHPVERRLSDCSEPNAYRLDISDSGAPLSQSGLERIFEEYASITPSPARSGAGLGLAICRSIVSRHGGRIWAENGNSGPVFSFVLPFFQSGERPAPADADQCSYQEVN